jgi:DNA-binding IclR family transcriptional regulator
VGALQAQPDRGYMLGLRLFELGTIAAGQRQLEPVALPFLRRLAEAVQLTCHLGVMEGHHAVYLSKVECIREIRVNTWAGKRLSLHSSSLGKVLLAWLPEADLEAELQLIAWETKGPRTLTDPARFKEHLRQVRERGWATDNEEDVANIRCVAAPVMDMKGNVVAAISAVGTVFDIDLDRFGPLAGQVCATAREISGALGHQPRAGRAALRPEPGKQLQ